MTVETLAEIFDGYKANNKKINFANIANPTGSESRFKIRIYTQGQVPSPPPFQK
jgi:hypothetical protein